MNYCGELFSIKSEFLERMLFTELETNDSISYRELQTAIRKWAAFYKAQGFVPGQTVAIHLHNSIVFILAHMAAQYYGLVSALLDPLSQPKSLNHFVRLSDAGILITHLSDEQIMDAGISDIHIVNRDRAIESVRTCNPGEAGPMFDWDLDRTCYLYFTSGTTSLPKGVPLTQRNHLNFFKIAEKYWQPSDEKSSHICFVPFSHGFGSIFLIPWTIRTMSSCFILRSFHPIKVADAIRENGITHIYGVPSHYQQLLKLPQFHAPSRKLQMAFCAAAKLDRQTIDDWFTITGSRLHEGYGLIETTGGIVWRVNQEPVHVGDVGVCPDPSLIEVAILDESDAVLGSDLEGEIAVRGDSVTHGYVKMPGENDRVFSSGWFHTGDKGKITLDGRLIMTGRIKDIINIAGIKISPFEVETVLNEHPNVENSVVTSIEDPLYGEVVKAFVIPAKGTTPDSRELIKFCSRQLINFQVPKIIEFVESFPLNSMGKVDRKKMRHTLV